jgi:hypothetical protein
MVAAFFKEGPQDLGLLPDGVQFANISISAQPRALGMSPSDARRTRTFWLLLSAFFLVGASVQGCLVHMPAMLTDHGTIVEAAALGSSIMGGAVLIGRVGTGYLLDRFFAPHLAARAFSKSRPQHAILSRFEG